MEQNYSCDSLHVLYSCDNGYAQHLGASIYSLLNSNRCFSELCIYILDNKIDTINKDRITTIVSGFPSARIYFLPISTRVEQLNLEMAWPISISSYGRLFCGSVLPQSINRILYLDCDTIVCGPLSSLWKLDLHDHVLGAVQDSIGNPTKQSVGLLPSDEYFNSGVLLIDLENWRKEQMEEQCINFIQQHRGRVIHHDQGVLNGVIKSKYELLPLQYNIMTIHYMFSRKKILQFYGEQASFYSEEEIRTAKSSPTILHFTPSFTCRPWFVHCKHPLRSLYCDALQHTPWKNTKPQKDMERWYIKLINWYYRNFY